MAATITIKDVAKKAGVSLITVSRVINGRGYVGADTRARVQAAIDELQYVPNQMASSLRSQQTDTLALILPDITNSFWTTIARGVEDEAWSRGYGVFLCNTDDDPGKEARYIDILLRRRVEGIIIVPTPESVAQVERLQRRAIPFVVLHRKLEGIDADVVRSDSRGGAFELTRRLLDAGSRRIAYIGGPPTLLLSLDRLEGYKEALASAGVPVDPHLIKLGVYGQETGLRAAQELAAASPRPEALLIANSRLAIGALHALAEAGLRVPEDIAVAAFYDIAALDEYSPLMTTVRQPAYAIGQFGVRRLLERVAGKHLPIEDIVLPNQITVRQTQPRKLVAPT